MSQPISLPSYTKETLETLETLEIPAPQELPDAPLTLSVAHSIGELDLDPTRRAHTAYIVVDVIRATTTLTVMFERGVRRVLVARTIERARQALATVPEALLAGEINAVAPEGFDHGNSPDEWGRLDAAEVVGREIMFSTTNGARGLHAAMGGGPVFAGALRNASAVSRLALTAARALATPGSNGGVTVVCSGLNDQPAEDDSLCAGWLIQALQAEAAQAGVGVQRGHGAQQALDLLETVCAAHGGADAEPRLWLTDALAATPAARAVLEAGLAMDLAWCADVDATTVVPMVAGEDVGRALLVVEKAPPDDGVSLPLGEELR